jgi:hypothetical protein
VDAAGHGTLIAWWRLTAPGMRTVLRTGESRLTLNGPAPQHDPQAMVATLSELAGQFSQKLAQVIRECAATHSTTK